jgi:KaiC/GvpD/RAD55 family RecA-like ATPase
MNSLEAIVARAKTGIWGLDDILAGGFTRNRALGPAS